MYIPAGVVDLREIAAPATPPAEQVRLYAKTDGLLYWKDDAGTERAAAPLTARTTAAVTNSTVTAAVVTGLTLSVDAGIAYRILAHGSFQSAATTTGMGMRLGGTATATRCRYTVGIYGGAAANQNQDVYTALSPAMTFTAGATTTAKSYAWYIDGVVVVAAAGTLQVEFASEVAASQITIAADAYLELQEVA